jgi:hypothetical protein
MPSDKADYQSGKPPHHATIDAASKALANGPIGALVVAGIATGLLFLGWLAFYFLLFMPRGAIG